MLTDGAAVLTDGAAVLTMGAGPLLPASEGIAGDSLLARRALDGSSPVPPLLVALPETGPARALV